MSDERTLMNLTLDLVELDLECPNNEASVNKLFGQLGTKVDAYVAVDKFSDSQIDRLKLEYEHIKKQINAYERVKEALRYRAMNALKLMNLKKLKSDNGHQMSIRAYESVEVYDMDSLPAWAKKEVVDIIVNKTQIKEMIKGGQEVEGAKLIKKEHINLS